MKNIKQKLPDEGRILLLLYGSKLLTNGIVLQYVTKTQDIANFSQQTIKT